MRGLAGAAALALVLGAGAGAAVGTVGAAPAGAATLAGDKMIGPPAGFTPLTTAAAINGPISRAELARLTGKQSLADVPAKVADEAFADSYARTWVNRASRDALVVMGFHLRNDDYAASFGAGALDSASHEPTFKPRARVGDIALFDLNDNGAKGEAALFRRGRYFYELFVVGQFPAADHGLAATLAREQVAQLPPGATSLKAPRRSLAYTIGRLVGAALILAVIVAVIVYASRRTRTPAPAGAASDWPPPPPPAE